MNPIDFLIMGVVLLIIGAAAAYIIKAKKSGKKCIGCPDGCSCGTQKKEDSTSSCGGNCSACSGCHRQEK